MLLQICNQFYIWYQMLKFSSINFDGAIINKWGIESNNYNNKFSSIFGIIKLSLISTIWSFLQLLNAFKTTWVYFDGNLKLTIAVLANTKFSIILSSESSGISTIWSFLQHIKANSSIFITCDWILFFSIIEEQNAPAPIILSWESDGISTI